MKWYDCRRGRAVQDVHPTEEYLKSTSIAEMAQQVMRTSPSLRYFFVELAGQETAFWAFDKTADSDAKTMRELAATKASSAMAGERF